MKFTTIARWEFKTSLKSKKFIIIFLLQLSVLLLMVFMFNSFASNIESQKGVSITPTLSGFASLDVADRDKLLSGYINPDIVDINFFEYNASLERLDQGKATGFFQFPDNSVDKIKRMETLDLRLYLDYGDPKRGVIRDEANSTVKIVSNIIAKSWIDSLSPENITEPGFKQEFTGEPLALQIIKKVMLALILFLPLFLFGNMLIDSVVGEKERKTGEILIAMPLSPFQILLGKGMAVVATIALQVALWMIILLVAGFETKNPLTVYLLVVMTAVPIVGITTMVATYSKNYKEAGIGLTFAYIVMGGLLIIPALAYLSRNNLLANLSPMTMVMRLFSGEAIPLWQFLLPLSSILFLSIISYWISVKLFKRDDVAFGPRPGIIRLFLELLGFKKSFR